MAKYNEAIMKIIMALIMKIIINEMKLLLLTDCSVLFPVFFSIVIYLVFIYYYWWQ
jgi:hypothetical protein